MSCKGLRGRIYILVVMREGAYNKQQTHSDRQMQYMTHLSKSVGEACDAWLEKRGMKQKSWMQQKDEKFQKKNLTP